MTVLRILLETLTQPQVKFRREYIHLEDGGIVGLDWSVMESGKSGEFGNFGESRREHPDTLPICLLIPGIAGDSREGYVLTWVNNLHSIGIRSVIFLNRGAHGLPFTTPITYDGYHNKDDLRAAVCRIREKYPLAPIIAGGTSMGGITLVHYLATYGADAGITAAMVQSAGWCVFESVKSLSRPSNVMFNMFLTHKYKETIRQNREMFEKVGIDTGDVLKCRTVREIQEKLVAPQNGFKSLEQYWTALSTNRQVLSVKVPLLALNAADDMFAPVNSIPVHLSQQNSNVGFVITARGGHIAFMEGLNPFSNHFNDRMFCEFVTMIKKCVEEGKLMIDGKWRDREGEEEKSGNVERDCKSVKESREEEGERNEREKEEMRQSYVSSSRSSEKHLSGRNLGPYHFSLVLFPLAFLLVVLSLSVSF